MNILLRFISLAVASRCAGCVSEFPHCSSQIARVYQLFICVIRLISMKIINVSGAEITMLRQAFATLNSYDSSFPCSFRASFFLL